MADSVATVIKEISDMHEGEHRRMTIILKDVLERSRDGTRTQHQLVAQVDTLIAMVGDLLKTLQAKDAELLALHETVRSIEAQTISKSSRHTSPEHKAKGLADRLSGKGLLQEGTGDNVEPLQSDVQPTTSVRDQSASWPTSAPSSAAISVPAMIASGSDQILMPSSSIRNMAFSSCNSSRVMEGYSSDSMLMPLSSPRSGRH